MKYKILFKSIFSWTHYITAVTDKPINFCIYCGQGFNRNEPCFEGNIFTRTKDAILIIIRDLLNNNEKN